MKIHFPCPIEETTISQCWEYMDAKRRKIRVRGLTATLGGFFSNLVFIFSLILSVNGLILRHASGSYCTFLLELSFFTKIWSPVEALLPSGNTLGNDILRLLLLSYCAAIVVFVFFFLLSTLLYHPKKRILPQESYGDTTKQLAALTREAWNLSYKTHISSSVLSIILGIASAFVLFFGYTFYLQDADAVNALLGRFPTGDAPTNCLLYVFFAYFLGHLLCLPILLICRPLYDSRLPYALVVDAAAAALTAKEAADGTPEQRPEKAVSLREEGIQAEYRHGYHIAKDCYWKAALLGDVPAMEHYARHCLLDHQKEPARYWLDKAAASAEASPEGKNMLLRLKLGRNHNAGYLQEGKDNTLKGTRRRALLRTGKTFLITAIVLGGSAAVLFAVFKHYGSDPAVFLAEMKAVFGSMSENISKMEDDSFVPEEVLPFETPVITLTDVADNWEQSCVAYDQNHMPVIFCYGKDLGGDLAMPCNFAEDEPLQKVGIYTGNKWDIRDITKHAIYEPLTKTITIAEAYLQTLEEGEYCLILNDGARYLPLVVTEQTTFNSTQRGLAAVGNENNWIVNDLEQPQDMILPFYNLGDNTIRNLFLLTRPNPFGDPVAVPLDEAYYTIAEDGRSVTILQDFLQMQSIGTFADFRVRLANGDILDTAPIHIGTVQGEVTGLMEIRGSNSYSLSKGENYTAQYQFYTSGTLDYFMVTTDSGVTLADQSLSNAGSPYIDLETQTITLPGELLQETLTPGEGFNVYLAYVSERNQYIGITHRVDVTR